MDGNAVWRAVLGEFEIGISKGVFETWFKNTELISISGNSIDISVANIFAKNQMEQKFDQQLKELFEKHGVEKPNINYIIEGVSKNTSQVPRTHVARAHRSASAQPSPANSVLNPTGLNDKYTFDNYIVGSSNELAYTACLAAAKDPGQKYSPLFIYGGVGLGKTHLMQAVGNYVIANNPDATVVYLSSEKFVKEFVNSIRNKIPFSEHYRNADVLIVDDVQFISGKEKTEEEFFHTFNELHQHNKQIIISSDMQPKNIPTLAERLRSRFEWGMTIDIQQPDYETRVAILQSKAEELGSRLDTPTAEYLAANIQTNVRELEGSLSQLIAHCEVRGVDIDTNLAKEVLSNIRLRPKYITAKEIIKITANHFDIGEDQITGPKRDKHIVVPRQIAMYLLRNELNLSFPKVATELGRKDHTTALHSVAKIEEALRLDNITRHHVNSIKDVLYA